MFVTVLVSAGWLVARRVYPFNECGAEGAAECPDRALEYGPNVELLRSDVCPHAGYYCFNSRYDIIRWNLFKGVLHVRVPKPAHLPADEALRVQEAAVAGITQWSGHPFRIDVHTSDTPWHRWDIEVAWTPGRIDVDQYSGASGVMRPEHQRDGDKYRLAVRGIGMTTALPPGYSASREVFVSGLAAHEMGHALGLGHSDDRNDVMFRNIDRIQVSQRDLLTVDALYRLPANALLK